MSAQTHVADVQAVIRSQKQRRDAMRLFPPAKAKPRKSITQADVNTAVNDALDALDREFRRLGVEFPAYRIAYDTARSVVQSARKGS